MRRAARSLSVLTDRDHFRRAEYLRARRVLPAGAA
jgi:hypothetical protein